MITEDTYYGTIYTSDEQGILFSKSLERHLFGGEAKSDFTNITSLRGVYLTNILEEGMNTILTLFLKVYPKDHIFLHRGMFKFPFTIFDLCVNQNLCVFTLYL